MKYYMAQENLSARDQYIETLQKVREGLQSTKQQQINHLNKLLEKIEQEES